MDCFQKIRQQVKCYLQLAGVMGKNECMQVGCQVDPVPVLALAVRVPGPAPASDNRKRDWSAVGLLVSGSSSARTRRGQEATQVFELYATVSNLPYSWVI